GGRNARRLFGGERRNGGCDGNGERQVANHGELRGKTAMIAEFARATGAKGHASLAAASDAGSFRSVETAYFVLRRSRISVSSTTSAGGAAGAASCFLIILFISLTTRKIAIATMTNWMTVLRNAPNWSATSPLPSGPAALSTHFQAEKSTPPMRR